MISVGSFRSSSAATRSVARAGARAAALVVAMVVALLAWPATPAAAETCAVRLDGLLAQSFIGTATEFGAVLTNDTPDTPLPRVRLRLHIALGGLVPANLLVERRDASAWSELADKSAADGDLKVVDDGFSLPTGGSATRSYRLTMLAGAPPGTAAITAVALLKSDEGWTVVGRSSKYVVTVARPAPDATNGARTTTTVVTSGTTTAAAPRQPGSPPTTPSADVSRDAATPTGQPSGAGERRGQAAASAGSTDRGWPIRAQLLATALTTTVVILLILLSGLIWRRSRRPVVAPVDDDPPPDHEPGPPDRTAGSTDPGV